MAHIDGPFIILPPDEAEAFHRQVISPDPEAMRRRDAFFAELDTMEIIEREDGTVEIEFTLEGFNNAK